MKRWLLILICTATLQAAAHHPFTPYYDVSKVVSMTGVVAEFRIINPHVVLILDIPGPGGGRWGFEGFPPNSFQTRGVDYAKFKPGTRITVSGWRAKDPAAHIVSGREVTFADGSTLLFGPTPEEADRWICSGPCPYKYPEVSSGQPARK